MAGKKTTLRTSSKESAPVDIIEDDDTKRAAYLAGVAERIKGQRAERLRSAKLFTSLGVFAVSMAVIVLYSRFFADDIAGDDPTFFFVYLGLYACMLALLLAVSLSSVVERLVLPLVDVADGEADEKAKFALSVIAMDECRDAYLAAAGFPLDRAAFWVDSPSATVVDNDLVVEFAICELASNRYLRITPCAVPWSDYCWWDEARRQREIGARLGDALRAFGIGK